MITYRRALKKTIVMGIILTATLAVEAQNDIYINKTGQVYVKANAPIYFFISPQNDSTQRYRLPSSDKKANPMYFDGDGYHYLKYQNKGKTVKYRIIADGYPPKPVITVPHGLLLRQNKRIYIEIGGTVLPNATDKRSGVNEVFYSLDSLPFKKVSDSIRFNRKGNYSVRVVASDNVGNISDTACYSIIVSPELLFSADKIFFSTASARILPESYPHLNEIVTILKSYPELRLKISAHADTRGNSAYNLKLSQKRALSVVHFLTAKGIKPYRLHALGFGDTKPVNECLKGVTCPESKHRENRRVEFRFYLPKR